MVVVVDMIISFLKLPLNSFGPLQIKFVMFISVVCE